MASALSLPPPRAPRSCPQGQFVKQAFVQSKSRMRRWAEQKSNYTAALAVCDFDGIAPVHGCYNVSSCSAPGRQRQRLLALHACLSCAAH